MRNGDKTETETSPHIHRHINARTVSVLSFIGYLNQEALWVLLGSKQASIKTCCCTAVPKVIL